MLCCCHTGFDNGFPAALKTVLCDNGQDAKAFFVNLSFLWTFLLMSHDRLIIQLSILGRAGLYHSDVNELFLSLIIYSSSQSQLPRVLFSCYLGNDTFFIFILGFFPFP